MSPERPAGRQDDTSAPATRTGSTRADQEFSDQKFSDPGADRLGATVTAYLVTGPVLYAALGGLADRWLGTGFLLPVGLMAGMALSMYIVWLRYGKP